MVKPLAIGPVAEIIHVPHSSGSWPSASYITQPFLTPLSQTLSETAVSFWVVCKTEINKLNSLGGKAYKE